MKKILYVFALMALIIACGDDDTPIIDDDPIGIDDPDAGDDGEGDDDPGDDGANDNDGDEDNNGDGDNDGDDDNDNDDDDDDNDDVENAVFNENVDGDLSNDNTVPTQVTLAVGNNRVVADQASDPRDIDYFVVTVPEGFQLSQLVLDEYRGGANDPAFLGFVQGNTFPVNVETEGNPDVGILLGGLIYGADNVGSDILADAGAFDGVIGFEGPLAAGEYTFWLNQTGAQSGGTYNFVIEEAETADAGAVIFTGAMIEITKAPNADFMLPENQDMITENVIITRGNTRGLFNIAQEASFASGQRNSVSPIGTEWAEGSTNDDLSTLNFMTWGQAVVNPPQAVANGTNYVLHLVEENIFIDVVFTSWSQGGNGGGGFSYRRSTEE